MHAAWIWGAALVGYGLFSLWYDNWRGPLRPQEIEVLLERARAQSGIEPDRVDAVRAFLEADDGREFLMVNLLRLQPEPVAVPGGGAKQPAREVLEGYTKHFMPALLRRAGHPALIGRAAGSYVERWGVEPDPGWSVAGVIRYRSRRDMMELAADPAFEPAHVFKVAALANTLAFPVSPVIAFSPRVHVALVLALLAALAQLLFRSVRGG